MTENDPARARGWDWFDTGNPPMAPDALEADQVLALAAARCFRGRDGEKVLAHLRAMTLERAFGPGASDSLLRHLEGQRQLVAYLAALVERGRRGG